MSDVSVEELKKRLSLRMLAREHLRRILVDTRLIVEYAKVFYNNTNYMGLYYVVLNIRDEIEKLDVEIEDLKREITTKEEIERLESEKSKFEEESE
jgi:cell division protein FtsB